MKRRLTALIIALALAVAVAGAAGIAADALGFDATPQVAACNNGSTSGGGC
jgi:hypothetical protein